MNTQRKLNIATVSFSLIAGILLSIKITDYYQLSKMWVDHPDAHLKNYILILWILVIILILNDLVWFYFRTKELNFKTWLNFSILVVTLSGYIFQFTQSPNYKSYHVTPYPISAVTVEKQVNSKSYNPYKDFPIYFYRKTDHSYKDVNHLIRLYSLEQSNDLPSINMATLEKELGKKRYDVVIKNAKINANNAFFVKYTDSNANSRRITFNNLQKSGNLNKALKFIDNH
ncbi:hypothetical protein [Levilactobacillus fujinensis]|uniref:Uncharacterized protein n=1 Tax=Levilactobacillus fujinensis TaxID=2486024 RepID=A0ABW1TIB2_9LACO|nr:hypothetical protein [Levilactobacillus fujinensis]